MRFGVQLFNATSGADWAEQARKAEDLGFSTLFMPDHFGDQLAPVPALMAAADATTTLNVGALVFDNDYKHPLVLAKEIATIDILSGGRVELGIGAGWMATDYEQSGIAYDRPGVRVDRMVEGIAVMKGMFADGPFSFEGEHYTITAHDALPKPAHPPAPAVPDRRWRQARARHRGARSRHRRDQPEPPGRRDRPRRRRGRHRGSHRPQGRAGSARPPATASTTSS